MNCIVHFYLLNAHFSEEHAEAHYNGEESEFNLRYEWEDELKITSDVTGVETHDFSAFPLQGELDGKEFRHDISDMRLFEIKGEIPAYVGCSESILDSYSISEGTNGYKIEVFLKDFEPMANPVPGIYIASQEFPKELVF